MPRQTRKDLNDKHGHFTLYVVETQLLCGTWVPWVHWPRNALGGPAFNTSMQAKECLDKRREEAKKKLSSSDGSGQFRIVIYARKE